jgi:hypothetical protein
MKKKFKKKIYFRPTDMKPDMKHDMKPEPQVFFYALFRLSRYFNYLNLHMQGCQRQNHILMTSNIENVNISL